MRGIFLVPSCANPTTTVIKDSRREKLAEVIKRHDLLLIEDDADAFLTFGNIKNCTRSLRSFIPEKTIYISSTSKPICSGIRVAYMVTPELYRDAFRHSIFNANVKTSSLEGEIITQTIISGAANEIMNKKIRLSKESNAVFNEYFPDAPKYGHPFPFFRWLPLPQGMNPEIVCTELLASGVNVLSSNRFLCDKSIKDSFIRVSVSSAGRPSMLEKGVSIIADYLKSLQ